MPDTFITSTEITKLRPFYYQEKPMYEWFKVLNRRLSRQLGASYAQFFAEPKVNPYKKTVDWYTNRNGEIVSLTALPEDQKQSLLERAQTLYESISTCADKLVESKNSDDIAKGEFLRYALKISNSFPCLYSVGGSPVIIGWGSKDEDGLLTKTEFADRQSVISSFAQSNSDIQPPVQTLNVPETKVQTEEEVQKEQPQNPKKKSVWYCGFGWLPLWLYRLLLLLLALLILWLIFKFLWPWLASLFFNRADRTVIETHQPVVEVVEKNPPLVTDRTRMYVPEETKGVVLTDERLHPTKQIEPDTIPQNPDEIIPVVPTNEKFDVTVLRNKNIAIDSGILDDHGNPVTLDVIFNKDLSEGRVDIKVQNDQCSGPVKASKTSSGVRLSVEKVTCASGDSFDPFDLLCNADAKGLSNCLIKRNDGRSWEVKAYLGKE